MATSQNASTGCCSRRKLLGWGGAGTLVGLAGWLGWPRHGSRQLPAASGPLADSPVVAPPAATTAAEAVAAPGGGELGRDAFLPHLHSKFQLSTAAGPATVCQLDAVSAAHTLVGPGTRFTVFSLVFTAAADFPAVSQIYHLTHEQLGALDLFLSPVGQAAECVHLEAVFSQRI